MNTAERLEYENVEELLLPCVDSTAHAAVTLFEEHISRPFCPLHNTIFGYIDDPTKRLVALAAPRGFGKSTVVGLCFPARLALFRHVHYIVYISATATEAAAKVKILAQELIGNPLIRELFGELKGVKWAEEKGEIELSDENGPFCFIQAKGAGSQVRGLKWRQFRPDIFIVDDLEDKEDAQNEDNRKKLKKWFFGSLLGAMDNAEFSQSRLVMIGTVVHEDSLLANLIDEGKEIDANELELDDISRELLETLEKFYTIRLEACDDQFNSIWPEFMSTERIRAKAAAYEARGLLDVFYMEYRNVVIAGENAAFLKSMFKYYDEAELGKHLSKCENVVIVDAAKTANTRSDLTAIVGIGFDRINNRVYFRDCVNKKLLPDEIFKEALDMADRLGAYVIGLEVTGINNFITYPFQQYIANSNRKRYYEIVEIKAIKAKDLRVAALVPFYKMGAIYHNKDLDIRGALEAQLLSFPYSKYWDVMDCFANFIELFDVGDRSFSYVYNNEQDDKPLDIEAEYAILDEQDQVEDKLLNWRCV